MKSFLIFLIIMSFSVHAKNKAGLLLEPIISYDQSDFTVDYPSPLGKTKGEITAPGIGARVGFHIYESLLLGADVRYSKIEFNDSDNNYKVEGEAYNFGPTLVLQLPTQLSLRIWGGYILSGELDPQKSNGFDVKFGQAQGHRLGVGLMVGTVSLNLEYKNIKYNNVTLESAGGFNSGTSFDSVDLTNTGHTASISFPLTL